MMILVNLKLLHEEFFKNDKIGDAEIDFEADFGPSKLLSSSFKRLTALSLFSLQALN